MDSYQRRDTLVFSGDVIPAETDNEDTSEIIVSLVNKYLSLKISSNDINISHRLGSTTSKKRPIIVKFFSRVLKNNIQSSCIKQLTDKALKDLYVNEHLTTKRKSLFMFLRQIRKSEPDIFKQLYTKDGIIIVKLKESDKYKITCEKQLHDLLKEFPYLQEIHKKLEVSRVPRT